MNADKDRGFIDSWRPHAKTQALLTQVHDILDFYMNELPLTLRQIFYRLVVEYAYEKTEQAYGRLGYLLKKARRADRIPFSSIRDDGFHRTTFSTYYDADDLSDRLIAHAERARLDRQLNQDRRIYLWCEAQGMVPMLEKITYAYGVPVLSSGGFDGLTHKYHLGHEFGYQKTNPLIFHVGDYDPSGEVMFTALSEDVSAFAYQLSDGHIVPEFRRLALTPEQIDFYDLPSAPAKKSTHSANFVGEAVQLEALDPFVLRELIDDAVTAEMDMEIYQQTLTAEKEMQAEVQARLQAM